MGMPGNLQKCCLKILLLELTILGLSKHFQESFFESE